MMEENFGRPTVTPDPDCRRDRRAGRPHGTRRGAGAGDDSGVPDHLRPPVVPDRAVRGPLDLPGGANPNAGSYSIFTYPNAAEDVKTAKTNFTAGLLGNPESVPKCPEANLQANTCPASTLIGTSRLDVKIAGTANPFNGFAGFVYNAEPLGNEPGRLGVVTPSAAAWCLSIPFYITPRGGGDYGLTGILDNIAELDAVNLGPPFGVQNLQVHALAFVLNGATNNYVRNPTSCGLHTNTGRRSGTSTRRSCPARPTTSPPSAATRCPSSRRCPSRWATRARPASTSIRRW